MSNKRSGARKLGKKERYAVLPTEMKNKLGEFEFGLHGVRENTKEDYLNIMIWFSGFLFDRGKRSLEEVGRKDIDLFLSRYPKPRLFIQIPSARLLR
jgi:hypothetical protein